MANRLTDLEIGHAYAPSLSETLSNLSLSPNDGSPASVVAIGIVVLAAYSLAWNILTHR